jgi:hypothetical protein
MGSGNAFVEFEVADDPRFNQVAAVIQALANAKRSGEFPDDDYWLKFFDADAMRHFWSPTATELDEWRRRWLASPVERRFSDPSLKTAWTFGSMIDAFRNGEYELLGCRRVDGRMGRLEYEPFAGPYGGTGCMRALLEAFGHRVTREELA